MHLYKTFFKLLYKYKVIILSYLLIFGFLMTMIGTLNSDQASNMFEEADYTICYIDEDKSDLSKGIIDYLSMSNTVADVSGKSQSSIEDMMFFRVYMHEFKFDKGFQKNVLSGDKDGIEYISDLPSGSQSYVLANQLNNYINTYRAYIMMGYDTKEAADKTKDVLKDHSEVVINSEKEETTGESSMMFSLNSSIWYIIFTVVCMSAGVVLVNAMEENLSLRIEAGPVSRRRRTVINILGLATFGFTMYVILMIANILVGWGSTTMHDYLWVIAINNLLGMLTACSLVAFITSFNVNNKSINMIAIIVGLGMSFISGAFVPQFLLGDGILKIARFFPVYWFVLVNNMTNSQGYEAFDMTKLLQSFGMQFLFFLVFSVGAAAISKVGTDIKK